MATTTLAPHRTAVPPRAPAPPAPAAQMAAGAAVARPPTVRVAFSRDTPDAAALREQVARLRALPLAERPARILLEVRAVVGHDVGAARAAAARLELIDAVVGVGPHVAAGTVAGTAETVAASAAALAVRVGADDVVLLPIPVR